MIKKQLESFKQFKEREKTKRIENENLLAMIFMVCCFLLVLALAL